MVAQLGFSTMLDAMEFARKTWSQLNLPTAFAPTMDVAELDRRVQDLKAVEQWLGMNLNMLRSTIQTMEVQRGTIAALQAFGSMVGDVAGSGGPAVGAGGSAAAARTPEASRKDEPAATAAPGKTTAGAAGPAPAPDSAAARGTPQIGMPGDATMMDPTAWWNMLQQQFQQVAGSALAGAALAGKPADAAEAPDAPADRRGRGG